MSLDSDRALGITGGKVIAAGETVAGPFFHIAILEDAVFDTAVTDTDLEDFAELDGITVVAGVPIAGIFHTVKLTSGTAIGYKLMPG